MRNPTEHFFNEIFSYYFNAVGRLINLALIGELTPNREMEVLYENPSFSDDLVLDKLHIFNEWFLMRNELTKVGGEHYYETDIECEYHRPVTVLERRWLKSIISDPRIQLFDIDFDDMLEDVDPLFTSQDFVTVGVYNDGDSYEDAHYQRNFRTVLKAIREDWGLSIISENKWGVVSPKPYIFVPEHIEYSEIEDKFSLYGYGSGGYGYSIVKMGRIKKCELIAKPNLHSNENANKGRLVVQLDGRSARTQNALERILIEFSHYNKSVREEENGDYYIELDYLMNEEKELAVLRLMPFAQYIRIVLPDNIKHEVEDRIRRQAQLLRFFSD